MNKKAFTLMELLLVVAILAIVAAAGMPIFSSGQDEAFKEAKKAAFLNSYQNAVSGANLMMGMLLTNYTKTVDGTTHPAWYKKGFLPSNLSLDALNQWKLNGRNKESINLNYYSPILGRMFKDLNNKQHFISAKFDDNQCLVFYYVNVDESKAGSDLGYYHDAAFYHGPTAESEDRVIDISGSKTLDYYWKKINNL